MSVGILERCAFSRVRRREPSGILVIVPGIPKGETLYGASIHAGERKRRRESSPCSTNKTRSDSSKYARGSRLNCVSIQEYRTWKRMLTLQEKDAHRNKLVVA